MASNSEDAEFLAERVKALEDANKLFSPQGKEERERWVAEEFLSYVMPGTPAANVIWVDNEPWDILCNGAQFQIKERQEPGRRRHDEFKEALAKARAARQSSELLEAWTPTTISLQQAVSFVQDTATKFATRYAAALVRDLDLLIYLSLDAGVVGTASNLMPACEQLPRWRSISAVCNDCAFVLFATESAPEFIRKAMGKLLRRTPIAIKGS